jgi:hypothetical protein
MRLTVARPTPSAGNQFGRDHFGRRSLTTSYAIALRLTLLRRMSLTVTREGFRPIIDQLFYVLFAATDMIKEFLCPVVQLCFAPVRGLVRWGKTRERV